MSRTGEVAGIRVPNSGALLLFVLAVMVVAIGTVTGGLMFVALGGGVAIGAVLVVVTARRGPFTTHDARPRHDPGADWPPADVINMSRIRVAGFGGLGLVAMAVAVAFGVQPIGVAMIAAVVGGAILAAFIISIRRRTGPLHSGGDERAARKLG